MLPSDLSSLLWQVRMSCSVKVSDGLSVFESFQLERLLKMTTLNKIELSTYCNRSMSVHEAQTPFLYINSQKCSLME